MIDLSVNEKQLGKAIQRARERKILIPTFREQIRPELISEKVRNKLQSIGLWDINPLNLFRISWKNEPVPSGGRFGKVNYLEFPQALTGVHARIIALVGKWFPTGSHKVGATFGCLVPGWSQASLTQRARKRSGLQRETSAVEGPIMLLFWAVNRSPSCQKG